MSERIEKIKQLDALAASDEVFKAQIIEAFWAKDISKIISLAAEKGLVLDVRDFIVTPGDADAAEIDPAELEQIAAGAAMEQQSVLNDFIRSLLTDPMQSNEE